MKNRSRIALLMIVLFMLGGGASITAYQSLSKIITLVDDGKVTQYETNANNVGELLKQLNVTLDAKDTVVPSTDASIQDNMKITIERWKPTVNFTLNGERISFETKFKTVDELITAKGLQNAEELSVTPDKTTAITDNMEIVVKTKEIKTVVEDRPIAFDTIEKTTTELKPGETKIKQEGKNGLKQVTAEQVFIGGEFVSENVKDVVIKEEAQDEIVLKGIVSEVKDASGSRNFEFTKSYEMEASAYTNSGGDGRGFTASGAKTFVGMVAVDPRIIPLGTKLYIQGYGLAIAGDTGGAIKGNKIDLFFNTEQECYNYGRRTTTIYVLKDQSVDIAAARK